jgi:hypothetical protein
MGKGKARSKAKTSTKPSHDDIRRDAPAYAAYVILLMRLLAFLTVQLHLDPANWESPVQHQAPVERIVDSQVGRRG